MNGAETLLGNGDMLYLPPGISKPVRIQSPFISSEEVERVTDFIYKQPGFKRVFELPSVNENRNKSYTNGGERDELFEEAARLIVRTQQGSVSLLQRRLKVGYARAARIVDELEDAGIVGPYDGSKAREVLVETEAELEQLL
jgi:S-DNA-T family DNA segregation ATPase FtsK/SpoIIIE